MVDVFAILMYYFTVYSISLIVTQSNLFKPLRDRLQGKFLGKVLSCIMCLPFWISIILTLSIGFSPVEMIMYSYYYTTEAGISLTHSIIYRFMDSVISSGFSWLINSHVENNLKNTDYE